MESHVRKHLEETESKPCKTKGQPIEGKPRKTIKETAIFSENIQATSANLELYSDVSENIQATRKTWK